MNIKLGLALSAILAASAIACSSASSEDVGSSEHAATSDIDHMFKRPDGNFDVWCTDGTTQTNITADQIKTDNVCGGPASSSSSSGSSGTSGNTSSSSSSSGAPPGPTACIGTVVPPAAAWKAPPASQNVCTAADLATLKTALGSAQTLDDIINPVKTQNAACASCIFTDEGATNWGPIVLTKGGTNAFVNWGACFARAPGGSDACGSTFYQQNDCGQQMCSSCQDQASLQACYGEAVGDAAKCGQYDLETACNGFATVNSACPDLYAAVGFNCGGQ